VKICPYDCFRFAFRIREMFSGKVWGNLSRDAVHRLPICRVLYYSGQLAYPINRIATFSRKSGKSNKSGNSKMVMEKPERKA